MDFIPEPREVVANIAASFIATAIVAIIAIVVFVTRKKAAFLKGICFDHEKCWMLFRTFEFRLAKITEALQSLSKTNLASIPREERGKYLSNLLNDVDSSSSGFRKILLELDKLKAEASLLIESIELISKKTQLSNAIWTVRSLEEAAQSLEISAYECLSGYRLPAAVLYTATNQFLSNGGQDEAVRHDFGNYGAYFCGAPVRYHSAKGTDKPLPTVFWHLNKLDEALTTYWSKVREFSERFPKSSLAINEPRMDGSRFWETFEDNMSAFYELKKS